MPHFQRMTKFFVALIKVSLEVSLPCPSCWADVCPAFVPRPHSSRDARPPQLLLAFVWRPMVSGCCCQGLSQSACPDLCLACVDTGMAVREAAWVPADPPPLTVHRCPSPLLVCTCSEKETQVRSEHSSGTGVRWVFTVVPGSDMTLVHSVREVTPESPVVKKARCPHTGERPGEWKCL